MIQSCRQWNHSKVFSEFDCICTFGWWNYVILSVAIRDTPKEASLLEFRNEGVSRHVISTQFMKQTKSFFIFLSANRIVSMIHQCVHFSHVSCSYLNQCHQSLVSTKCSFKQNQFQFQQNKKSNKCKDSFNKCKVYSVSYSL